MTPPLRRRRRSFAFAFASTSNRERSKDLKRDRHGEGIFQQQDHSSIRSISSSHTGTSNGPRAEPEPEPFFDSTKRSGRHGPSSSMLGNNIAAPIWRIMKRNKRYSSKTYKVLALFAVMSSFTICGKSFSLLSMSMSMSTVTAALLGSYWYGYPLFMNEEKLQCIMWSGISMASMIFISTPARRKTTTTEISTKTIIKKLPSTSTSTVSVSVSVAMLSIILSRTAPTGTMIPIPITCVDALIITPPSSSADYRQLASLLVSTFDAPPQPPPQPQPQPAQPMIASRSESNPQKMKQPKLQLQMLETQKTFRSQMELLQWNLIEKSLTEQYTYNQYMDTMKKMMGSSGVGNGKGKDKGKGKTRYKYALYIAKEYRPGGTEENNFRAPAYEVVGMVEMGMTLGPVTVVVQDGNDDDNDNDDDVTETRIRPRATIGVLCVRESCRHGGVGRALVQKCEQVAGGLWDESRLFVEVEPDNLTALGFFRRTCGYGFIYNNNNNGNSSDKRSESRSGAAGAQWKRTKEEGEEQEEEVERLLLLGDNAELANRVQMRNAKVARRRKVESRPHVVLEKILYEADVAGSASNEMSPVDEAIVENGGTD